MRRIPLLFLLLMALPGAAHAHSLTLANILPFLILLALLALLPPLIVAFFLRKRSFIERYVVTTGIWIGILVAGLVIYIFISGRTMSHKIRETAERWTLERVETIPEQLDGITIGVRVKASLKLSSDIDRSDLKTMMAAWMPFGLALEFQESADGQVFSVVKSDPMIRRDGTVVTVGPSWPDSGVLPKGTYEVEQVFWTRGIALGKGFQPLPIFVTSPYFNARSKALGSDSKALCKVDVSTVPWDQLAKLDGNTAKAYASVTILNDAGIKFAFERIDTERKATTFVYRQEQWKADLSRVPLPDCKTLSDQLKQEAEAMQNDLNELGRRKMELEARLSRGHDGTPFDPQELRRQVEEMHATFKSSMERESIVP